jgi:hypothetical protein
MEKLIELLFQQHPEFKVEVKGCSDDEIENLEKLIINTKMPEDYKIYLKYMGRNTGRVYGVRRKWDTKEPEMSTVFMNQETKIDYQSVLNFYKKNYKNKWLGDLSLAEDYGEKAENFFFFGIDCLGNDNGHLFWIYDLLICQ